MTLDVKTLPTLVIGHRNPDMDAIGAALGYAWLLNQIGPGRFVAGRTGKLNPQTEWALERFAVQPPELVADVYAHVGALALTDVKVVHPGQKLIEACQVVAETGRPAPLIDAAGKPVGLLTRGRLFGLMAQAISSASVVALADDFNKEMTAQPDSLGVVFKTEDQVGTALSQAMRADENYFLVTDDAGSYVGLVRQADMLTPPRRKIILVDHNEPKQAVPGLEEADLVEVLDHHRLGNLPTETAIRFYVDPVGCTSTLVTERALAANVTFPPEMAGVLLCAILSDTLVFRSPTTTERDQTAAHSLAAMAGLVPVGNDSSLEKAVTDLGNELLMAGAGLGQKDALEIINTDFKFYEANGYNAGLGQVDVANFKELPDRLADLTAALEHVLKENACALALLMVTDVVNGNSRLLAVGEPRIIAALPYKKLEDGTFDAPEVVSRKKQLLPVVLEILAQS